MISSRPYLLRAIYDWIIDNGLTPYVLVNAGAENTSVPTQFIQDGKIILNISSQAVRNLQMNNDWVMFSARFSGTSMEVSFPPQAVMAIYAKENGRGMVFSDDDEGEGGDEPPAADGTPSKGRPSLRVVK
ncbi:MAG: ClpXP protease specificity-enhancing factor [Gammaproteobacteria bacterium]|nr:ClpXP protease specificity-enhancing factor [Gammaproteobacteria bacterium]